VIKLSLNSSRYLLVAWLMSVSPKRSRTRKASEAVVAPISHADQLVALHTREEGKTVMYKQDAWGHIETRFVRTHNVKAWEEKGFSVR
jgi:hypothetical protein